MSSQLTVAVLTITPQIHALVLSSFEFHPVLVSSVTLLLLFLALQASPRKMGPVSFMLWANTSSTLALHIKVTCKNIKEERLRAAPWVFLLVASPQADSSPFIKIHFGVFFTYFLPAWSSAIWALILPSLCMCRTLWAGSGSLKQTAQV